MNSVRKPLLDPYRTLRKSFLAICSENVNAALLLDYFVSIERALDEARSQGERFGEWRELSAAFIGDIILTNPSRYSVRLAIKTLAESGFIQSHPENANNKGGYARASRNRYRLCVEEVRAALAHYHADQNYTAPADAGQNQPAVVVNNDQQRWSKLTSYAGQNQPQESVVESVAIQSSSSTAGARMRMIDLRTIEEQYQRFAGRLPTPEQRDELVELAGRYGADQFTAAVDEAIRRGAKHIRYIRRVLENPPATRAPEPEAPAPAPRVYHTAADDPLTPLSADELVEWKRIRATIMGNRQ